MSFLFRKNGSSSRRKIKEKLRGRHSDRGGKREEDERYGGSGSDLPPPPSPWGFLFPEDFVRIDGNLKAVIVDDEGLDVIYWKKLLELENSGKIRKNPKPRRRGDKSGDGFRRTGADQDDNDDGDDAVGDESIEEAFSFHVKKSQSASSSGGEIRDQSNNGGGGGGGGGGGRYYTSSSASPSRPSSSSASAASPSRTSYATSAGSDYGGGGGGKQSQSKFQAPGGGSFPSSPSQIHSGGGRSPPLPLPPGQFTAGNASFPSSTQPPPGQYMAGNASFPSSTPPSPGQYMAGNAPFSSSTPLPPGQYPAVNAQLSTSSPSVPLPPGQYTAVNAPFSTSTQPVSLPPGQYMPGNAALSASTPLTPGQFTTANAPPAPPGPANQTSPPPPPPPSAAAPPPPPPPKKGPAAPPPPPPPGKKGAGPPPPPPMSKKGPPKPPGNPKGPTKSGETSLAVGKTEDPTQPKLKPLHWDKMNPDASRSMVWHKIDGGSFNFDGDLMEALFGYVARKPSESNSVPQNQTVSNSVPHNQTYILDPRKSQNKAIVLKSLGMTKEEIIDLLTEGHDAESDTLEKLAGIAPTPEEQTEIIDFDGEPMTLAYADSLLFHILKAVPSAFNRFNVMLFKINYGSEVAQQKGSLLTLESACNELRARGLFMKLLEAILKAGNRMNAGTARGNAQAFNLTALRKLSDVKSVDAKTTLLHFVVEEVVRSEGKRAAMNKNMMSSDNASGENADMSREEQEIEFIKMGLPIIGGLSSEFTNVKKAAGIDYDSFVATTLALGTRVKETKRLLDQSKGKEDGCLTKLRSFFESAEEELKVITEEQLRIMELVKKTTNYYQAGALKERNLFQLFVIIRDFLGMVDNACSEIARNQRKQQQQRPATTVAGASSSPAETPSVAAAPQRNAVRFPILPPNFMSESSRYSSSSDSDSES
ncbi:unnamed protein product [Arabidopsis thaliana]|uniref:Formin-like protein n=1 Tax=Arabidopsis thaliana TaxID=3702 RepID=A0A5S9WMY5_ARATH|nr:unnamed protein product [Arabidopsis thaliana]